LYLSFIDGNGILSVNEQYTGVAGTVTYDAPPAGTYYMHMLVTEGPNYDTFDTTAARTFSTTETFSDPVPLPGGGGGGGSVGWITLGGLAVALLTRRRWLKPMKQAA
jgi:hypothetical protein